MEKFKIGIFAVATLLLSSCFGSKMTSASGGEVTGTGVGHLQNLHPTEWCL